MLMLSLLLNIAVLLPVCFGLTRDAAWVRPVYGAATPARSILLALYGTILVASSVLLLWRQPIVAETLLALQIAYKLATPLTVGTVRNPVIASNLAIAAFHAATLWTLLGPAK